MPMPPKELLEKGIVRVRDNLDKEGSGIHGKDILFMFEDQIPEDFILPYGKMRRNQNDLPPPCTDIPPVCRCWMNYPAFAGTGGERGCKSTY